MISVIISSRSPHFYNALLNNISETIGVEYEIIKIENSNGRLSITKAYNQGAEKAKFSYLCFVHEDVLFKTQNWGRKIVTHFEEDESIGLIGVAGAVYKSKMSSAWWQTEQGWDEIRRMNLIQHYKDNRPSKTLFVNPYNENRAPVVTLDGVLLITTKQVWQQNKFDDKLLQNFHGYDLDFCLQVFQSKKVVVVYDVLIDHFSGGNSDGTWLTEIMKVHKKWKHVLPLSVQSNNPEGHSVYTNGLKRLRKQMNVLLGEDHSLFKLIKLYNTFFSFLDDKPSTATVMKDYLKGLIKIIRLKYAFNASNKMVEFK